ncbi:MAG: type II/IV secretion system protein [Phycisphaerales bacterium]|nr:type II/IV secretion system protein [Phycisphaerales bacterium]
MGRFDIDQLLKSLGTPEQPIAPAREIAREEVVDVPSAWEPGPPVVDAPRPPDARGDGLGGALGPTPALRDAAPTRVRPDDALSDLYVPSEVDSTAMQDLATMLLERGVANAEQIASAQRLQKQSVGRKLSELLREAGVSEHRLAEAVAELARMPFERIAAQSSDGSCGFDKASVKRLTVEFCKSNHVLPLRTEGTRLIVGSTSPDDVFILDELKRRLGISSVRHVLVAACDIHAALQTVSDADASRAADDVDVDALLAGVDSEDETVEVEKDDSDSRDLEAEADSSPVVRYVNHIIQSAVKEGASDIHIEPDEKTLKVRFRIDGVLFESMTPPKKLHAALTSRLKIMANLDIAEKRLPQDGRIRATVMGRRLDLRVSTVPTPKGEKTVMRILDNRSIQVTLDDLGFAEDTLTIWKKQIEQPHGIILVTGPTGSGKTTTLYSSIRQMDTRRLNVSTVEDPVEYNLSGITQIQTHERIGMTFAKALKALLRQDPDVIMVGEIRDTETAQTAIQAALTGHLVLSTLHTNDAPSSITRLINIGVEPFLVGAALHAVLAQRLVRKICPHCITEKPIPEQMEDVLSLYGIFGTMKVGAGCNACRQTGHAGRVGLYELLVLDDFLRDKVSASPNVVEFRRICIERGMATLRDDGFAKVKQGRTTVEDVLRVTEATA